MKLWPFAKKPEEVEVVEQLSPGCDLPEGVMLAAPESVPTPTAYAAPKPAFTSESPAMEPKQPEASRVSDPFLPAEETPALPAPSNVPPFSMELEQPAMPMDIALPPLPQPSVSPFSSPAPELNLEAFQWTPGEDTDEINAFSLGSDSDSLSPPSLEPERIAQVKIQPPTNLAENWATAPMPTMLPDANPPQLQSLSSLMPDFSPEDLALCPPEYVTGDLGALSDSPLHSALSSPEFSQMLAPPAMQAEPDAKITAIEPSNDLAATLQGSIPQNASLPNSALQNSAPQDSMMTNMLLPPETPDLMPDFGAAPTWGLDEAPAMDMAPAPINDFSMSQATADWPDPSVEAVSEFDLDYDPGEAPEPFPAMASMPLPTSIEPEEELDSWSDAEDVESESADLNSSDAAYDMNHYDDPDAPTTAIELDKLEEEPMSAGDLQALADMLTQVIPQKAPETYPTSSLMGMTNVMAIPEEQPSNLDNPEAPEASDSWDNLDLAEELYTEAAPSALEPQEEPAPTLPMKVWREPVAEVEAPAAYEGESLPQLNGRKALPVPNMMEVLSAKFIARPKQLGQPTTSLPMEPKAPSSFGQAETPTLADHESTHAAHPQEPNLKGRTLSQAINNFEQEMLLNETRFVKQSINNLVDQYFAQQETENS